MLTHLQQHKILPGPTRPGEEQTSPSRFAPLERSGWQPVVPCLATRRTQRGNAPSDDVIPEALTQTTAFWHPQA